jgi:hypothetical protein
MFAPGYLQWHDLRAEFHKSLLIGSKIVSGRHTDRRTDRIVIYTSLFFFVSFQFPVFLFIPSDSKNNLNILNVLLFMYLQLTWCSRTLLKNLIVAYLVTKFSRFYGN